MRLRNVFLVCADLEATRQFYVQLGLPVLKTSQRSTVLSLGGPELHLHAPLTLEEEQRFGVVPGRGEGVVLCLETADLDRLGFPIQVAPWGKRMCLIRDPDGRVVELSE